MKIELNEFFYLTKCRARPHHYLWKCLSTMNVIIVSTDRHTHTPIWSLKLNSCKCPSPPPHAPNTPFQSGYQYISREKQKVRYKVYSNWPARKKKIRYNFHRLLLHKRKQNIVSLQNIRNLFSRTWWLQRMQKKLNLLNTNLQFSKRRHISI